MNNVIAWFGSVIAGLIPIMLKAEGTGAAGADKKAAVVSEIMSHLKDPNVPINMPSWLPENVVQWVISLLVDLIVTQLNKLNFFSKS